MTIADATPLPSSPAETRKLPPAVPLRATGFVREIMSDHGAEIATLHRSSSARRLIDLIFPLMLAGGMTAAWLATRGGVASLGDWALYLTGVAVAALGMNSCFLLIHEGTHGILHPNRRINAALGFLLGSFGLIAFSVYKVLHLKHHRFLGQPGDPDHYDNYTHRRHVYWLMQYLRLAAGSILYLVFMPVLAFRCGTPAERRAILLQYLILLPLYAWLFTHLPAGRLAAVWLVPLVLANFMINIRGMTQHGATQPEDELTASRSVRAGRMVEFFLLGENFHLEHHLFPTVPSYNLARLSDLLAPRLPGKITSPSYTAFLRQFIAASWRNDPSPIRDSPAPAAFDASTNPHNPTRA